MAIQRFFAQHLPLLPTTFGIGVVAGLGSGYSCAELEMKGLHKNSKLLKTAPAIISCLAIGMRIVDAPREAMPNLALSSVLGFCVGFCLAYSMTQYSLQASGPKPF
ncbi:MAG: hypothetical protein ABI370_06505 [Gammaproteobacteria bacterium]